MNNKNINLLRNQNKSINNPINVSNSYLNPLDNNIILLLKYIFHNTTIR